MQNSLRQEHDNQFNRPQEWRQYHQQYGNVVYWGLIPQELCDAAVEIFEREIKQYQSYPYRQASGNPEKHYFDSAGHVLNSLLNLHSVNREKFLLFRIYPKKYLFLMNYMEQEKRLWNLVG